MSTYIQFFIIFDVKIICKSYLLDVVYMQEDGLQWLVED